MFCLNKGGFYLSIHSLSFIFLFLPLTLGVFCLVPKHYKVFTLVVASLFFYWLNSQYLLAVMAVNVVLDYFAGLHIISKENKSDKLKKFIVFLCTIKAIVLVVIMSLTGQFSQTIYVLGVTIYTFTSLGYIIDLYHKECEVVDSIYDYLLFCCFLGKLVVGPVVSAQQFMPQLKNLRTSSDSFLQGFLWFTHGIAKIVILASTANALATQFKSIPQDEISAIGVWVLVLCDLFVVYYTFSGYSDMARGMGALFGLSLPENFHYPFRSESVTMFFSNFNISANRFVRKYIYKALGAEDNGKLATTLNIMLITMIMGIWYDISLNMLLWGSFLGVFIVIETIFADKYLVYVPSLIRIVGTIAIITLSFTIFSTDTLSQCFFYLRTMFGITGADIIDPVSQYLIFSHSIVIILLFVFSTGIFSLTVKRFSATHPKIGRAVTVLINILMLVATVSYLV